jgi:ABC-2 type transport system ATP-binding protein
MQKLGKRQLTLHLQAPLGEVPADLAGYRLALSADRQDLVYSFDAQQGKSDIAELLRRLAGHGIGFKDLQTAQSSLEDIFVSLVRKDA